MRILGIESSCDETSAAVVRGPSSRPTLESLVILSQDVHTVFGGVVPEIASREHLTAIVPVAERALKDAGTTISWLACLSESMTDPTLDSVDAFIPPADRTSLAFEGYIADVNIDIATNEIVRGTLTIQRSGVVTPTWFTP